MHRFNQMTDTQLVSAFQKGNLDALETLVERHKDKLYTTIYFLVKDKYLAEDLFQEVFIKVIDTLQKKQYNDEGKFLPWLLRIAHNLCIDYFRKVQRKPTIINSDNQDVFEWLGGEAPSKEQQMIQQEWYHQVEHLLQRLPAEQREVIVLRHYGDMSFKEIAQVTNCSINTALGRMRYGLINLRKMMDEHKIAV
ncbi:MAG TPA: RNA polymerase subunit sigma-24 [Chitinophagaceae bacterium]|nr:RNA polymerase subunit sigma-24 [Chitinophagaceae bacterium]HAN38276.1 RNA polymerase subunit sigma-24 [Chitinophagaceae bacterium]